MPAAAKPRKPRSRTVKNQVTAAELTPKVMKLRREGYSMRDIATKLKKSVGWVHKIVTKQLKELNDEGREESELFRQLQIDRYEALLVSLAPLIRDGMPQAIDAARKILDSLNKVTGAEMPTKVAPTTPDGKEPYSDPANTMTESERLQRIAELQKKLGQNDAR